MKLITDSNLELVVSKFYNRIVEEFSVADSAHKLATGRTLTIGETAQFFDGTQDLFWSLTDIGIGSPSNLNTSNKSNLVNAINELNTNKASIAYVDNAVENVSIDDAVTAVELVGNVDDIEIDFVTQSELEEALSNLDDIDIEGMVTAVDVGSVDIEQGGSGGSVNGEIQASQVILSGGDNAEDEFGDVWDKFDSIDNRLNELFQSANNGKQLIADAIGSPLSSSDTFSAMSTKINTLTTNFKSALLNKGVAISGTDTFQSLIAKIENITGGGGNTGSLVKTGELAISPTPKSFEYSAYFYEEGVKVPITEGVQTEELPCWMIEADFTPIVIDVRVTITLTEEEAMTYTFSYNGLTDPNAKMVCNLFLEGLIIESNLVIEGNKIYFPDIMLAEISADGGAPSDYNMITAYTMVGMGEVGDDPVLLESLKSVLTEKGVTVTEEDNMASLISKVDEEFDNSLKHASGTYTPTSKVASVNVPINLSFTPTYFVVNITGIGAGSSSYFSSGVNSTSIALSTNCSSIDWYLAYTDESGWQRQGALTLTYSANNFRISGGDTTYRYFDTSTVFTWHAFG